MNSKLWIAILVAVGASGCASTPQPNAALESARTIVRSTEADPNVAKYAALDMESAKKELEIAESAALRHEDAAIAHPAYLAAQTARLAQMKASAKADDARVAAGQTQRDNIQLAARTRDVDTANQQTDTANRQTETAKLARDQATSKTVSLQAELDALKAKPTDRGIVLPLGDVLFDTGKSELNSGASRKLDRLVQFLVEHPDRRVEIDGFTDSLETGANTLDLSQRRADEVRLVLQGRGIDPARITSQGYGTAFPVASNVDAGSRQLNRRVEVVIGGDNGAAIAARR
jgi:outer membrane protein OmpA-like peptidoglycan-associated protein